MEIEYCGIYPNVLTVLIVNLKTQIPNIDVAWIKYKLFVKKQWVGKFQNQREIWPTTINTLNLIYRLVGGTITLENSTSEKFGNFIG